LYYRKQTRFISAHNSALAALALSADGKRLATCSDKGTLVRVWNTADGTKLQVRPLVVGTPWESAKPGGMPLLIDSAPAASRHA
jgi:WD40 repeat protein